MIKVVGSYLSPYVRKVLVCLDIKGVDYEIDPLVPFFGDDRFTELNPVRRIPLFIDDDLVIPDSSVICAYLEDRYPNPSLLPEQPGEKARARWLEEFAGSRMGEVFIWRFFNELVIRRFVWRENTDDEIVRRSREVEIPSILDYLESLLSEDGRFFDDVTIAEISVAVFFRNISLARTELDMTACPRTARLIESMFDQPYFRRLQPFEEISSQTPINKHREALAAAGAPVSAESFFSAEPRRGVLSI